MELTLTTAAAAALKSFPPASLHGWGAHAPLLSAVATETCRQQRRVGSFREAGEETREHLQD